MQKQNQIFAFSLALLVGTCCSGILLATAAPKTSEKQVTSAPEPVLENVVLVTAEDLVAKPNQYLGKNVKLKVTFFAFTNLALDYAPALRSSKTYLSFLVLCPSNSHVPLSELKIAMLTPKETESDFKMIGDLKEGDQLEIAGKVFSAALDDPWLEVIKLKKIASREDKKNAHNNESIAPGSTTSSEHGDADEKIPDKR